MTEHTLADENVAEVSAAFDLLSNARRRGVLYAVGRDGRAAVDDLAERIAAWQRDGGSVEETGGPSADEVRTSLVHVHLPKLADAGVVAYDRSTGIVRLTESATDLEPYLRRSDDSDSMQSGSPRTPGFAD
ncbi:hypothetical protein NGM10_02785 [Halorussus salilacus]|uniref:DUF7344 domain-containing protein n=1 Tax=Halorussus salilacus TaxID=2953750 RepID=UPI0020A18DDD|nr:hypothetical protein [Halorussus salilacus]USZ68675.1 hypothetical protein NGM10_02785 [Halorussus salilacus]